MNIPILHTGEWRCKDIKWGQTPHKHNLMLNSVRPVLKANMFLY